MKFALSTVFLSATMAVAAADVQRKYARRSSTANGNKEGTNRRLYHGSSGVKTASHNHGHAVPQKTVIQYDSGVCPSGQYDFVAAWAPDDHPYENSWSLKDGSGSPIAELTGFTGCPNNQCYLNICLDDCKYYELEITDSYGDGLTWTNFGTSPYFYAGALDDYGNEFLNVVDMSDADSLDFGSYYWSTFYTIDDDCCFDDGYICDGDVEYYGNDSCDFCCSGFYTVNGPDWCAACGDVDPPICAVEGRPLIDASGIQRQAEAIEVDGKNIEKKWSEKKMVGGLLLPTPMMRNTQLEHLSQEWTHRALGEHASIGSFAIFTMALLTNQAPPDLIQASLTAAEDELRHAKVSFEVASLLRSTNGESPLEPGPFPSTSYDFSNDMTALAVGAAEEGCVDETLSALVAAAEADYYGSQLDLGELGRILQGSMDTIAMEEGRHSILAWRTVHWACQKDMAACEAAKAILDASTFQSSRFSGPGVGQKEQIEKEWDSMHKTLVSLVMTGIVDDVTLEGTTIDCTQSYESMWTKNVGANKSRIEILAGNIIHGVYCSVVPGPEVAQASAVAQALQM